jgi:hypothetical protein
MCKKNGESVDHFYFFTAMWLVLSGILSLVVLGWQGEGFMC